MQFDSGTTRIIRSKIINGARKIKTEGWGGKAALYCNLQLYNIPPSDEISLSEFDEIALERLKVLKTLEDVKERFTWGTDEFKKTLTRELARLMPIAAGSCPPSEQERARRRDIIGHFILRLAFCRSSESTKWLVNQEVDLFKYRFGNETKANINSFLTMNNMSLDFVDSLERDRLMSELSAGCGLSMDQVSVTDFWKVDFTEALDLVRRRRVFLHRGIAYIPFSDLVFIICSLLRTNITSAMARAFKHLAVIEEEGRLLPRLSRLANNAYSGKHYIGKENVDKVTRQMIDQLCVSSFPPCMRHIHHKFRTDHHLKHGARRQYGLFLKAIGLSLEEAIMFMKEEFTKKIDSDKFEKQYAYNIRHMYGKEGRRVEYPSLPCSVIILNNPPATGDCHGCPFKHTDHQLLSQRLERDGLSKDQINQIINMSKANGFDKACTRFFEYTHKMEEGALGHLITHPNTFFELSQEVLEGKRGKDNHFTQTHGNPTQVQKVEMNLNAKFSDEEN